MGRLERVRSVARTAIFGEDTPYSVAMGASLGMFVALTPTLGIQMILAVIFAAIFRANRLIAVAMVWISNPITIFPLLYAFYACGAVLTGTSLWKFQDFADHYERLIHLPFREAIREVGSEVGYPILIGSLSLATLAGLLTYPIVYRLVVRVRKQGSDSDESSSDGTTLNSGQASSSSDSPPGDSREAPRVHSIDVPKLEKA